MNDVALYPDNLNVISLCTGGGGLDLGLELALPSARSVVMVEREAFAVAHLVCAMRQGLLAPAALWSDVRTFNGRPWRGLVDGVIGGIPCQPHSLAGKRLGKDDDRDLWSDARRIIVQSGAWFVLIENVSGMLSSGGAERIWRDLHRLGFKVEGGLFTAAEVGASHERNRLFILAVADSPGGRWNIGGSSRGSDGCQGTIGRRSRNVADASDQRLQGCQLSRSSGKRDGPEASRPTSKFRGACIQPRRQDQTGADTHWTGADYLFPPGPSDRENWQAVLERAPELEPSFRRVADELASPLDIARVDRLRLLGNGVVPIQAAYAFRTLATRLATRGSAGAARLVRMMEI